MDRRDFLKATFAASAATVTLGAETAVVPARVDRRVEETADGPLPQMVAQHREAIRQAGNGTTDLNIIAQHLMTRLNLLMSDWANRFPTRLAENFTFLETKPSTRWGHDGCKIGMFVDAYRPGPETFEGPRAVLLTDQISALWTVPSHRTGGRAEHYSLQRDILEIIPEVQPDPVDLSRLDPIVQHLHDEIRRKKINVFSPGLYIPQFGETNPQCEGAVGFASRDYGLAIRVVRCLGREAELMMRADLIGGTFPVDVPVDPSLVG